MSSLLMQQIEIPADHFFRTAPRSYNDWMAAVIREFHQNCTDAQATRVTYTFDKSALTLTVTDNGTGCTADDIKDKLLTLGGSDKNGKNTTGGFGVAKEILYFPWLEWSIRTKNVLVNGSGSKFHEPVRVRGTEFNGFEAKIKVPDSVSFDRMQWKANDYLRKCEKSDTITFVNNEQIQSTLLKGRLARQFSWADIYVSEDETLEDSYAHVRVNGVHMFSCYVGSNCPQVIVEVTASSIQVLTSNRDGFRSSSNGDPDYQGEFQGFIRELIIDKKQAVRDNIEHTELIKGSGAISVEDPYLKANDQIEAARTVASEAGVLLAEAIVGATDTWINDARDVERVIDNLKEGVSEARHIIQNALKDAQIQDQEKNTSLTWVEGQADIINEFVEAAEAKAKSGDVSDVESIFRLMGSFPDVVVKWRGDDKRSVQKVLNLKSVHVVIKAWIDFLKLIMLYSENYGKFKVGVGIGLDGVEALYYKEDGYHVFLIDPMINENGEVGKKFKTSSKYALDEILDRAVHEVVHVRMRYHDVDFCSEQDRIRRMLRPHMDKFKNVWKMVKEITPKRKDNE